MKRPAETGSRSITTLDYELWRRAEDRREAATYAELTPEQRLLVPLVLSLARLAAQRDSHAAQSYREPV